MVNSIEYKLYGKYALFSDPLTRVGGEKFSYPIPTYQALKGITESIYWKPTIMWIIDECRVMNRILTEAKGIKPINYAGGRDLANYTYLRDVEYHVRAHFEFNLNRPELAPDRNESKHYQIAKRSLAVGGKRPIFLGCSECPGYVEPCRFEDGKGYYDDTDLSYGIMYHGITYADEHTYDEEKRMITRLWNATMKNGIIHFPRPEDCTILKKGPFTEVKPFCMETIRSVDEEVKAYGLD